MTLFFLQLSDVETAVGRVAERVRQGGHDIPEPVIRRATTPALGTSARRTPIW